MAHRSPLLLILAAAPAWKVRTHLDRFGTGPDGRLFRGARGSLLSESSYGRVWQLARQKALTPAQGNSPLVLRPYDLQHSGVTLDLNAGVPAPEVARRAGHGVAVLLRVYAGCIGCHAPGIIPHISQDHARPDSSRSNLRWKGAGAAPGVLIRVGR
jgi:integrase